MSVTEIAPDCYRISTYIPEIDLQFNQFLIKDDEPLLFHTGMRVLFPAVREAVARGMGGGHLFRTGGGASSGVLSTIVDLSERLENLNLTRGDQADGLE